MAASTRSQQMEKVEIKKRKESTSVQFEQNISLLKWNTRDQNGWDDVK